MSDERWPDWPSIPEGCEEIGVLIVYRNSIATFGAVCARRPHTVEEMADALQKLMASNRYVDGPHATAEAMAEAMVDHAMAQPPKGSAPS